MYPATSNKFSTIRPPSPTTFVNFSPPSDYPSSTTTSNSSSVGTSSHHHHHQHNNLNYHNNSMSMKHSHTKNLNNNNNNNNKNFNKNIDSGMMLVNSATMNCSSGGIRNELMFHDDVDSIEFCMPDNIIGHNNGSTIGGGYPGDSFTTERRRRGHSRRSNHKLEVEQQVKWTRKNIAATMERFEPTPSTSSNNIDYGTTTTQTIQQQQQHPINHVYSYAYYEPGAAKCHTNIPAHKDLILPSTSTLQQHSGGGGGVISQSTSVMSSPAGSSSSSTSIIPIAGPSKSPPRNSIRALLAKSFRSKALMNNQHYNHHHHQQQNHHLSHSPLTSEERHTYTTRYGTTENLYEEVNDQKIRKVLSDNRIVSTNVKEELRRVQHNHFRVLDELNLSLEALIMPPTPPDISPTVDEKISHASSMENLSSTLNSIELKDHTCINPEFDEGDLDSGFSGSGSSSGASYNESLRYYKTGSCNNGGSGTGIQTTTLPHNIRSCRSSTASGTSTSKSSMNSDDHGIGMSMMTAGANNGGHCSGNGSTGSPFNFIRRCSDTQRSISSGGGGAGGGSNNGACGIIGGTKPKKHFWTIKQ